MLEFIEEGHIYRSLQGQPQIQWVSVSGVVHALSQPFDAIGQSQKSSKNKRSKWYGMDPADIRNAWDAENKRSTDLGHWYHTKKETEWVGKDNVFMSVMDSGGKIAPDQRLTKDGVYPEHLCYLQSHGICGQSDEVVVEDQKWFNINDHKSNKEIRTEGYYSYETGTQKMLPPLAHMEDCEFSHYALQLSLYAYMIQRHNPHLKIGCLTINHVKFEEEGQNKYGYPIHKLDSNGEPIVKEVNPIVLPYKRSEVISILEWLKTNRQTVLNRKH